MEESGSVLACEVYRVHPLKVAPRVVLTSSGDGRSSLINALFVVMASRGSRPFVPVGMRVQHAMSVHAAHGDCVHDCGGRPLPTSPVALHHALFSC